MFQHRIVLSSAAILLLVGCDPFGEMPERFRETVEHPNVDFAEVTGFDWPSNATILSVDDSHGGFHGDGEFQLIFDVSTAKLKEWLEGQPPWDTPQWKRGPVPHDIAFHSSFEAALTSSTIWYAAQERCCQSLRWHNGSVLAFDLESGRVWLTVWDF